MNTLKLRRWFAFLSLPYAIAVWLSLWLAGANHPLPWVMFAGYASCFVIVVVVMREPQPRRCSDPDCYMCERGR